MVYIEVQNFLFYLLYTVKCCDLEATVIDLYVSNFLTYYFILFFRYLYLRIRTWMFVFSVDVENRMVIKAMEPVRGCFVDVFKVLFICHNVFLNLRPRVYIISML